MILKYTLQKTTTKANHNKTKNQMPIIPWAYPFLSFISFLVCLAILVFSCWLLEMEPWRASSQRISEIQLRAGRMAPFYVTLLANFLRPSSSGQATPTLSQWPEFPCGAPCYFRGNGISKHLHLIQLKSPHHKEMHLLKVRIWDLPMMLGL